VSVKEATKRKAKIYFWSILVIGITWVVLTWIYKYIQAPSQLATGKGWLDLWIQFLSGGWAGDLIANEGDKLTQYPRDRLAYLISAGFIIQGLAPTLAALWIIVELIELRWRITMRASGLLLEQQDMMAVTFREAMLKLLPESERQPRWAEMDWISQDTAYEVTESWCKYRAPREMGKKAAAEALAEIREMRAKLHKNQPKPPPTGNKA
jgi:hypothetical protein